MTLFSKPLNFMALRHLFFTFACLALFNLQAKISDGENVDIAVSLAIESSAKELAQIYHASMLYIFGQQPLINSHSDNKDNLFGNLFIEQVKETYTQIYNQPFPQENIYIKKLLTLMRLVMEDNRSLLSDPQIRYKGFIPAIFAFQLSEKFRQRGYGIEIKFTNFADRIRNPISSPDKWEQNSLFILKQGPKSFVSEIGVEYEGNVSTRYMRSVNLTPMCLNCHGTPENNPINAERAKIEWTNKDITGFEMEGWKLGELGGAISVVIYELNKSKYDES